MSENQICLICLDLVREPKQCNGCKNLFCKVCVLKWKQKQNMCPLRCSQIWEIDLKDVNEKNSSGFLICPLDKRIGNLNCISCKNTIIFNRVRTLNKYECKFCKGRLIYYEKSQENHELCDNKKLIYFFCEQCDIKMCDCILNLTPKLNY